ncbi:MAG: ABC transporter substrate-binding protein [Alphaproteobacteria bacterium]|nr:ABC transporter substrate-binding protein [Alphaproteobacteria bacterium]MCW5739748.1 ABC transporter substrate-binding protein [Alphaproteobacteria bacterium]
MRRRLLVTGAAAAIAAGARAPALAQRTGTARVGFLIAGDAEPGWSLFRKAMTALGHVEGQTIHYEFRASDANRARLAAHAQSLVDARVDVIVAVLTPAILAAKRATSTIPIVFNGGAPETGIVSNIARPEGNLTGVGGASTELAGKSIQLFRDIKPATKAVGVLLNAPDPFNVPLRREIDAAGRAQQIEIVAQMVSTPQDLAPAFEALAQRGVDGVVVQPSLPVQEAARLAIRHRLPSVSYRRQFADAGGLFTLGADQAELYRILAGYVDRVLKGTPTADLPVQKATHFELVLNQKTAKAIGLSFTPMFLARVNEVIE